MVNITFRPLDPLKGTPVTTEQEVGGLQRLSGCFGEEKDVWVLPGFEPWNIQPVA
jgi:hypothetical protein